MVAWHARIFGETRSRILELLRDAPQSAVALADQLGVTHNAIRQHLSGLGAHGLVERAGVQRDTGGKPAQLYTLTATGEELFPKGYAETLVNLIDEAQERGSISGNVEDLLQRTGVRMGAAVPIPAASSLAERVELAAKALHTLGGDMSVEKTEDGWRLRGRGCPIAAVVSERSVACRIIRAFIAEVTRAPVSGCDKAVAHSGCLFTVSENDDGTDADRDRSASDARRRAVRTGKKKSPASNIDAGPVP